MPNCGLLYIWGLVHRSVVGLWHATVAECVCVCVCVCVRVCACGYLYNHCAGHYQSLLSPVVNLQGRIQDFYKGVSISQKL